MTSGYYDYEPLLYLDRHLAVAGLVGADTRAVGYRLAALSGLNYLDLDRQIEHSAGRSVESILALEGEATLRDLEAKSLDRLLRDRPHGVLALGDGALLSSANRSRLMAETTLVALEMNLEQCFERCRRRWVESGETFWHPLHREDLVEVSQVEGFWSPRQAALALAPFRTQQQPSLHGTMESVIEAVPALRPS